MFPGFERRRVAVGGGVEIQVVSGGRGPALLLLHGYPQTHAIWRKVAPRLAERFTVVAADLRGYGDSSKPVGLADHSNYSKRVMAQDQVDAMRALGHERFLLCGHDRGGRVAHRLAVDHPERVARLAVLDIAPTQAMYAQTNMLFARAYFHWFFLIQRAPLPETLIGADPELWMRQLMGRGGKLEAFLPDGWPEYLRAFRDPAAIHASCEDYRAAAGVDLEHDAASQSEGRRVECPLLVLWGLEGIIEHLYEPLEEWRKVAREVRGRGLPCGHYVPEEAPELLTAELVEFFAGSAS